MLFRVTASYTFPPKKRCLPALLLRSVPTTVEDDNSVHIYFSQESVILSMHLGSVNPNHCWESQQRTHLFFQRGCISSLHLTPVLTTVGDDSSLNIYFPQKSFLPSPHLRLVQTTIGNNCTSHIYFPNKSVLHTILRVWLTCRLHLCFKAEKRISALFMLIYTTILTNKKWAKHVILYTHTTEATQYTSWRCETRFAAKKPPKLMPQDMFVPL